MLRISGLRGIQARITRLRFHVRAFWHLVLTLTSWRWKTQRSLIFITGLGMLAAAILISSFPLFFDVMTTGGLRNVLRDQPENDRINIETFMDGISTALFQDYTQQINNKVSTDSETYITASPQITMISGDTFYQGNNVDFYGVSLAEAASHLQLLDGHLPAPDLHQDLSIDVLLTRSVAEEWGKTHIGDVFQVRANNFTDALGKDIPPLYLQVHIVGFFTVHASDPYWNGHTLEAPPAPPGAPRPPFLLLTDQSTLLTKIDALAHQQSQNPFFFPGHSSNYTVFAYHINISRLTSNSLETLINGIGRLQQDISHFPQISISGFTTNDTRDSPAQKSILERFRSQVQLLRVPSFLVTTQLLGLVLFFLGMLITALVEREEASIILLRSRGANSKQIFGAIFLQSLLLCFISVFAGTLLSLLPVLLVSPHFLTANTQDATNALLLDWPLTLQSLVISALLALGILLGVLALSLFFILRSNALSYRQQKARSTAMPIWQRLKLDILLALLAVGLYTAFLLFSSTKDISAPSANQALISTPVQLLAPLLLLLAATLGFLRFFPLLLNALARTFSHRRGLNPLMAIISIQRSPRTSIRTSLMLGLAIAFTFFVLSFSSSQQQRILDVTSYQSVSDLRGYRSDLPATTATDTSAVLAQIQSKYASLPGISSVSVGRQDIYYLAIPDTHMQRETMLMAVDASTFAQTASWEFQASSQSSLSELMAMLRQHRPDAINKHVVPAVVTSSIWNMLHLTPGAIFYLNTQSNTHDSTPYMAIQHIDQIPPVNDTAQSALLVDYSSLVVGNSNAARILQPNYIWLHLKDASAFPAVRQELNNNLYSLSSLVDRQLLMNAMKEDPLTNHILLLFTIGIGATLLLAFLAILVLPLLNIYMRLKSLSLLRALGTPPAQITSMIIWELAFTLLASLGLGFLFGLLLSFFAIPPLIFTGILPSTLLNLSDLSLYTSQSTVPAHILFPPSLLLAFLFLVLLALLSIWLMQRMVQRPLLAQILRLSED